MQIGFDNLMTAPVGVPTGTPVPAPEEGDSSFADLLARFSETDQLSVEAGHLDVSARDELMAAFEGLKSQMALRFENGETEFTPEATAALTNWILASPLPDTVKQGLLDDLDSGVLSGAGAKAILDDLLLRLEETGMKTDETLLVAADSMAPMLTQLLMDAGFSETDAGRLLEGAAVPGEGIDLAALAETIQGRSETGETPLVAPRIEALVNIIRTQADALGATGGAPEVEMADAEILRQQVLAGTEKAEEETVPASDFRETAARLDAEVVRSLQPGEEARGVTESRFRNWRPGVSEKMDPETRPLVDASHNAASPPPEAAVAALPKEPAPALSLRERQHADEEVLSEEADGTTDAPEGFRAAVSSEMERKEDAVGAEEQGTSRIETVRESPVKAESAEPAPERPAPKPAPAYAFKQVGRQMRIAARNGDSTIRFQLKPVELGRLHMEIEEVAGNVHVKILTERKATHEMLLQQSADLKASLEEQGVRVEKIEVAVAGDFDQAMARQDTGQHRHGGEAKHQQAQVATPSGKNAPEAQVEADSPDMTSADGLRIVA